MTATLAPRGSTEVMDAGPVNTGPGNADADAAHADAVFFNAMYSDAVTVSRPQGLDRLAIVLGVAMLRWARKRADRGPLTREQHTRAFETARDVQLRQHRIQSLAMRVS